MSGIFYALKDEHVVWMLAFNGGLYDASGYFELQGLFTSSITGNIVSACGASFDSNRVIAKTCVTVSFFLAAGFANTLLIRFKKHVTQEPRRNCMMLLGIYLAYLVVVWIVGTLFQSEINQAAVVKNQDAFFVVLVGSLMGAAMGTHNIAAKGIYFT